MRQKNTTKIVLSLVLSLLFPICGGEGERGLRGKPQPPDDDFEICVKDGTAVRLWTMDEVRRNRTCNIVFYDRVYYMEEFIPIHKGGAWPIERNCGTDSTWLFENLQCIAMVPDHFEGMLNMCAGYIVGAIKGSAEDPCANDEPWVEPEWEWPDFEDCDVYDNITCADLATYSPHVLDPTTIPFDGRWTLDDVANAQESIGGLDLENNKTDHCFTILHDWVFDLGVSPLDGSDPFYVKHGNSEYPQEILKHCGKNMTAAFDLLIDKNTGCVPDHTLGGMNVLSGYVVGVVFKSDEDPCDYIPQTPCERHVESGLKNYTMAEVTAISEGCPIVVLGKVYDLAEFANYHHGGSGQIMGKCGRDITNLWLKKDYHLPRIHLGSIQRFQTGVIIDSINDPCNLDTYDADQDF